MEGYDELPPFSSFLPGLAGVKGIPLWAYYTNRGQGINSFGIHNKNNAIMEFNPANTAYENTPLKGFRTFIKCNGEYFEPFLTLDQGAKRNLYIKKNSFEIEEINYKFGIKIKITYFILPNDSIGALVRKVEITNLDDSAKELEVIDGLPKIIPFGITNAGYKEMSNLLKSWTEVKNIDQQVPFYTMRASSDDSAEVSEIEGGYFYLSVMGEEVQPVIYDADVIFDQDTSLINPISFLRSSLKEIQAKEQCFYNKVPCGFTLLPFTLLGKEMKNFFTMVGFAGSPEQINEKLDEICTKNYLVGKEKQAEELVEELTGDVRTHTAKPEFDQYIEQCYLDNFLRGGYPFVFNQDKNKAVVHLFSRKHGDPERDYNFFSIAGEYYSQGNGNFRDVSQNRRNDVFFNHEIGDFNIKTFFQLIQIDGYNPLEVRPSSFTVKSENKDLVAQLLKENVTGQSKEIGNSRDLKDDSQNDITDNQNREASIEKLEKVIQKSFTPGQVANCIARNHIEISCGEDAFLETLLSYCSQNIEAGFGEGYWSDHWDYNMDLIESYLSIYPEKENQLLFEDQTYRFYDSAARVMPRSETYVLNSKKEARQYGSMEHDREKEGLAGYQKGGTNWLKTVKGDYAQTSLMVKMISLALNKFTLLDSYGMGVEMEGGKPGWNDAMNGLPGLFGSGMPETFELKRMLLFIQKSIKGATTLELPVEVYKLLTSVYHALVEKVASDWSDFTYWDTVATMREQYREEVRFTVSGEVKQVDTEELHGIISAFVQKLTAGIQRALTFGDGIVPTYFTYHASEFDVVVDNEGNPELSHYGLPKVKVKAFEVRPVPSFLEGPTKMLSTMQDVSEAESLCKNVTASELFDTKLKMYKTSVSIEHVSMEHGRIRAFTPGWLERESIFLHMEYKYLLSMLKAGLYERYYEELPSTMITFRDPAEYGRSILENSSFLASSSNPNEQIHGRGYVSRLSGSTTEAISIWIRMFMGEKLFSFENEELKLEFNPKLVSWLFDEKGEAAFTLLSKCKVTYHNPSRKSTFGADGVKVQKIVIDDTKEEVLGNMLCGEIARRIRNGEIKELSVYLG
jgi:hypothetical protein